MPHVFICHTSAAAQFGYWLAEALYVRGFSVWIDDVRVVNRQQRYPETREAIEGALAVIGVISPPSPDMNWQRRELEVAQQNHKRIITAVWNDDTAVYAPVLTNLVDFRYDQDSALVKLFDYLSHDSDVSIEHFENIDTVEAVEPMALEPLSLELLDGEEEQTAIITVTDSVQATRYPRVERELDAPRINRKNVTATSKHGMELSLTAPGEGNGRDWVRLLEEGLFSRDPSVRQFSLRVMVERIGELGQDRAVAYLRALRDDSHEGVRRAVSRYLAMLGEDQEARQA